MATRNEIAAALGELIVPREGGFVSAATVARLLRKYVGGQAWIMVEVDDVIRCIGGTPVTGDRHGWEGVGLKATEVGAQRLAVAKWEARLASEGLPAEVDKADTVDVVKSQLNRSYYDPLERPLREAEEETRILSLIVDDGLSIRKAAECLGIDRNKVDRTIQRVRTRSAEPARRKLVRLARAAKILGISVATLKRMASNGKIPFSRIGKERRFDPSDLRAFLTVSQTGSTGSQLVPTGETTGQ